jgi:DNA polymerase ligase (LigD)-like protein
MNSPATQPSHDPPANEAILLTGRFVVLRHETPADAPRPTHWDFMLETVAGLRTWALAQCPADGQATVAESLSDHRIEYLTYEGPISKDRGHVEQFDAGSFECRRAEADEIVVGLAGRRLRGQAVLRREADKDSAQRWRFSFAADPT